jgi:prolyl oligopeptidase
MRTLTVLTPTLSIATMLVGVFPLGAKAQSLEDPYLWLEEVEGARALEWAEAGNAETREQLTAHPRYQLLFDQTLEILTSSDRIAFPEIQGDDLYNVWTDEDNPRGIYRRTSWESYLGGDPEWEAVLDLDVLSDEEQVPWTLKALFTDRVVCLEPENRRCMVSLARGGSDATEVREFDRVTKMFVSDGFQLPEAKQGAVWVDEDHLLVATAGDGQLVTTSGYAASVRLWQRGTLLSTAPVVFEVDEDDMAVTVGMIDTSRAYDVPLIYISYPLEILANQQATNTAIRTSSRSQGIPVVASFDAYKQAVEDGHTGPELIVDAVGPHPTRLLYRYVVDLLLPVVDRLLAQS